MLRYKGVEFTRLDLPNMSHKLILPLMRYRGSTVPVITIEGRRVSGTMKIARALEALVPEPPLFPAEDRATIEGAEAWADSVLQDGVRQMARWATGKDKESMSTFLVGPVMGIPERVMRARCRCCGPASRCRCAPPTTPPRPAWRRCRASSDRVDALLAEGVIGGERPNAADFQIAPSVSLALCFDQLRPFIEDRPAGRHARKLVPDFPGRFKEVFPPQWLPF